MLALALAAVVQGADTMGVMDTTDRHATMAAEHQMADPRADDPHMKLSAARPLTAADSARGAALVAQIRAALVVYRDVQAARADGYRQFLPGVAQPVYHFTSRFNAVRVHGRLQPLLQRAAHRVRGHAAGEGLQEEAVEGLALARADEHLARRELQAGQRVQEAAQEPQSVGSVDLEVEQRSDVGSAIEGEVGEGGKAAVAIRPEDISVGGGPNAIAGKVENVEYGGHESLIDVRAGNDVLLHVRTGARVKMGSRATTVQVRKCGWNCSEMR